MYLRKLMALVVLMGTAPAFAIDNFVTNPAHPYPPGCVSNSRDGLTTPTGSRQTYVEGVVELTDAADNSASTKVLTTVFRRGCKEPERSVLYIKYESITANRLFAIPKLFAQIGEVRYPLRTVNEPNTFDTDFTGAAYPQGSHEFLVDGMAESRIKGNLKIISPSQYNGPWILIIQDALDSSNEVEIPLDDWESNNIRPFRVPLNGRLSGIWVTKGARDQGYVISFSELLNEGGATEQLVFFSWYTYDSENNLLWLSGGATYDFGASETDITLELVSGGTFMDDAKADRMVVDTITLRTEGCNELTLTFDLSKLGLPAGEASLKRLFALETAGYACRDVEARLGPK